jgi:MerC mercury resistance protein
MSGMNAIDSTTRTFTASNILGSSKTDRANWLKRAWLYLSGGLSFACAVHCALVPLIFVLAPSLKMALFSVRDPNHQIAIWLMQSVRFELPLVLLGLALTATALVSSSFSKYFDARVWSLFAIGSAFTVVGAFSSNKSPATHGLLMVVGGVFLVAASVRNARIGRC